jgi:hypothetical protein
MFQPNRKLEFEIITIPIGTLGVEEVLLSTWKTRLVPPMNRYLGVVITTDGMRVLLLGMMMEGKKYMIDIPQMETPSEMGKEFVGPMAVRDDKVDITVLPLVMHVEWIEGSTTLDEALKPNMV